MPKPTTTYISLGSNIGDRKKNIVKACDALSSAGVKVIKLSSFYLTSPIGPKQRDFINAAAKCQTRLAPRELLIECKRIEKEMGRKLDAKRNSPRIIDLDILLYGNKKVKTASLTIPHPQMQNRRFVLEPLAEIAPHLIHPTIRKRVSTLRKALLSDTSQKIKKL